MRTLGVNLAPKSRSSGGCRFTKLFGSVGRLQRLGEGVSLLVEANGQYAFSQLLAAEEFGIGGARFGCGYDPSELTGDHGLVGRAELR